MAHVDQSVPSLPPLPPEYVIRRCDRDDLPSVGRVDSAAFSGHDLYPQFFFVQALDIFAGGFLVAERAREVVGYIIAVVGQDVEPRGWILSLGVHPDHQRRGIGSNLTAEAEAFLAGKGLEQPVLTVDPANTTALRLYEKLGYEQVGKLRNHFGEGEDRLLMKLRLTNTRSEPSRVG
ncbi:GNAT family N-acetyltransferase [Cryptosporangium minutisporangium]|uniref:GNAT family N-acetyltransferase n=1 Tax=Cryptosporangium minutisporangium TaxID=113569 RepID=A0ABP6TCE4_9ACTN